MTAPRDSSLETIRKHWKTSASISLTEIDWLGHRIQADWIVEQVELERQKLRELLPIEHNSEPLAVGIAIDNGPANLILGLALMLEGIPQAIVPIHASATEQTSLIDRVSLTHRFSTMEPPPSQRWEEIGTSAQGLRCWRCLEPTRNVEQEIRGDQQNRPTESHQGRLLLIGTTSGTTSSNPGLVTAHSGPLLDQILAKRWSPYNLISKPLLTPEMQNWSSRYSKLGYLLQGKTFVVRDAERPLADQPPPDDCDGTMTAPGGLRRRLAKGDFQHCREGFLIISGADRVPMDLREAVTRDAPVRLGVTYATSQTGPLTWLPPEALLDETESVGWPLPDVTIQPLETRNKLKKNGLTFTEAWISTPVRCLNPGDLLSLSKSGQVIFGGRANDVFLFNSMLISPYEIEDVLRQHPGVEDCAAFGACSERFSHVPMAAFTTKPHWPAAMILQELEALCREALGIRRPRKLIMMDAIPKGNTGKALRRELSRMHALQQ